MEKLIVEHNLSQEYVPIVESAGGAKNYFIEGVFAQANLPNVNRRVYPLQTLRESVDVYVDKFVSKKRALGELGHPPTTTINEDRCSHIITEMKQDGNNFIGRAKILSTPKGNIVKNFIDEGVKLAVSTRGVGRMEKTNEGLSVVQPNFKLITVDVVVDPSGPDCFVDSIMESTEYFYDAAAGNWIAEKAVDEIIAEANQNPRMDNERAVKIFHDFLRNLK